MLLFNRCLWHNYKEWNTYFDCSDVCMWSSGTSYYRQCKDCGHKENRRYHTKEWSVSTPDEVPNKHLPIIHMGLRVIDLSNKNPKKTRKMVFACNDLKDYYKKSFSDEAKGYKQLADNLLVKLAKQCPEYLI